MLLLRKVLNLVMLVYGMIALYNGAIDRATMNFVIALYVHLDIWRDEDEARRTKENG